MSRTALLLHVESVSEIILHLFARKKVESKSCTSYMMMMMILTMKIMKIFMKTNTFLIRIYNFISVTKDLNMMMEMTSKIITKKKMIMEKNRMIVKCAWI